MNTQKLKLTTLTVGFYVFALVALPQVVFAGIGVSPAQIDNSRLKPGAVYRQEMMISQSDPTEDIVIEIEPDMGDANAWFSFEPSNSFKITKGVQRFPIIVQVRVPENVALQPFKGVMRIKASSAEERQLGGVAVVKGARVDVNLVTTNLDFKDIIVRAVDIEDMAENKPGVLSLKIENKGNIPAAPSKVLVDVQDLNQNSLAVVELLDLDTVPPGETKTITKEFVPQVDEGEYFAKVTVYLGDDVLREERMVFRVTGKASLDDISVAGGLLQGSVASAMTVTVITAVVIGGSLLVLYKKKHNMPAGSEWVSGTQRAHRTESTSTVESTLVESGTGDASRNLEESPKVSSDEGATHVKLNLKKKSSTTPKA